MPKIDSDVGWNLGTLIITRVLIGLPTGVRWFGVFCVGTNVTVSHDPVCAGHWHMLRTACSKHCDVSRRIILSFTSVFKMDTSRAEMLTDFGLFTAMN